MAAGEINSRPDVIVIGGGPAGSAAATMLAVQGIRVILLERERFPRDHVGESLLPASIPVLEELGALAAVQDAGFLPKWGATMVWGKDSTPWSWYFKETNRTYPHAYQVWRPRFDSILLDNSRAKGVDVREGHRAIGVLFEDGRAVGVRFRDHAGREQVVRADFIVDASGQNGLLGRQLGLREWDDFFQNLAVYGYFSGGQPLPSPDETNIFIEAYPQGWLWNIPLPGGRSSVGAVVDSSVGQAGIAAAGVRQFLLDQIAQAPHLAGMLRTGVMAAGPSVVKDWSYVCRPLVGNGYILAGDAACFVDPLFSSGVHLALMSGVLAAAWVSSALKQPDIAGPAGLVYQEMYLKEYRHFRELARLFYSSNRTAESYFWEARRIVSGDSTLSPRNAFIRAVAGQPPRGYERAVLERGVLPPAFVESVENVESERVRRLAALDKSAGILEWIPRLADGVKLERKPTLAGGEFRWGHVLSTPDRPEGVECADLVAALLSRIDGRATAAELIVQLQRGFDPSQQAQVAAAVRSTLSILYVDGDIDQRLRI